MVSAVIQPFDLKPLQEAFGERLQFHVPLERYTAARLGGAADLLIEVDTVQELSEALRLATTLGIEAVVLGGGSNILVSDRGIRGLVIVNRARQVRFDEQGEPPTVWAESGANLGLVARMAAQRGLAGLEWAVSIPGTVGGAVVGNAGAHGGDMAHTLIMAEILRRQPSEKSAEEWILETWPQERMGYSYRSSVLKGRALPAVVLAALLRLEHSDPRTVQARMETLIEYRKRTQPPGASMGSMFKNPPGDYAGRLIEAAGLKGRRIGGAQISPIHANFFVNVGGARASDVYALILLAQEEVMRQFGVALELEIELLGEW